MIVALATYAPGSNPVVYFGNDGGLYRAKNVETVRGATGWEILNNGLAISQFYSVAASADGEILIGGLGTTDHSSGLEIRRIGPNT